MGSERVRLSTAGGAPRFVVGDVRRGLLERRRAAVGGKSASGRREGKGVESGGFRDMGLWASFSERTRRKGCFEGVRLWGVSSAWSGGGEVIEGIAAGRGGGGICACEAFCGDWTGSGP